MKGDVINKPIGKGGDDYHPFSLPWLDSCYQQTLLPNAPWTQVRDKINTVLARKVSKQLEHPDRRQILFDLLGDDFVQTYFPKHEYNPSLLEPPLMSPDERRKLHINAQSWLRNQVNQAAEEVNCQRSQDPSTNQKAAQCPEMVEFLQHTYGVVSTGMNRHLYLLENEIQDEARKQQAERRKEREAAREAQDWQQQWTKQRQKVMADAGIRSILKKDSQQEPPPTASTVHTTLSAREREVTTNVKGAMHGLKGDPPMFWSLQSNSIGRSLLAILQRDPRRFNSVVSKLHGRQLPGTLRTYIWTDVLLKREREKLQDANVEKIVRERFGKAVTRGVSDLHIKRATHSPISGLIDNAVIEIYHATASMVPYIQDNLHMKCAAKALNVLYVYDRSYEPYLIHWLFPLQLAYQESAQDVDHVYELAMHLDLLNTGCFPKWPEIFAIAEKVMAQVKSEDRELYDHLSHVAQIDVLMEPKEFLVQLIHKEKAEASLMANPGSEVTGEISKDLLADPLIFIRKWVGEGFVGVLDTQAVLFVWDQFFMQHWTSKAIEDVCLSLLLLLRNKFLATRNYSTVKSVFLDEPCKLYTMDIQKAWVHLQQGGRLELVPPFNRYKPKTPPVPTTPESVREADPRGDAPIQEPSETLKSTRPTSGVSRSRPLDPAGIKNIRIKLVFSPDVMQREKWLTDVINTNFRLTCSIYFGSVKLRSKHSQVSAFHRGTIPDQYGGQTVRIDFPGERFVFDDLDPSHYDVEREMGGFPYAVIRVDYFDQSEADLYSAPVTLGWGRIKLYQQEARGVRVANPWVLMKGDCGYILHSGPVAETISGERTPTPKTLPTDLLAQGSEIQCCVYDPRDNNTVPSIKAIRPPPVKLPEPAQPVTPPEPRREPIPEVAGIEDKLVTISDPFDLYIDGVNNIPDNATIIKATGRIIKQGQVSGHLDILAIPDLNSSARSPRMYYRLPINLERRDIDPHVILLIRVYTVDVETKETVVIGSCMFAMFDPVQQKLLNGGYERHLHYGMPDLSYGIQSLTEKDLDPATKIPGCSVNFRLLPHAEEALPHPDIPALYYKQVDTWNVSESRVIDSFNRRDRSRPVTVRDMIKSLQQAEQVTNNTDQSDAGLLRWMTDRLDHHKLPSPANSFDLSRAVDYRRTIGLNVQVNKAYGLPDGQYIQCFVRVSPGSDTMEAFKDLPDEKMVSLIHDYDSLQKAPVWIDDPKTLHPVLDPYTVLIIQIFGLDATYKPQENQEGPGEVKTRKGQEFTDFGEENNLGWAVVPLFEGSCVMHGEFHVPIFKGRPDDELTQKLSQGLCAEVIDAHNWTSQNKYESAGLVVTVWDAHFEKEHHPEKIQRQDFLLDIVGDKEKYSKSEDEKQGKKISQFVIDSLPKQYRNEGTNGARYRRERELHQQAMSATFYRLMENALMNAGYGPL